jgi:thienamycin biosynthesis protein ThnN
MTTQSMLYLPDGDYVRQIVGQHLDPLAGTPYWLEEDRRRGANSLQNVCDFDTFKRFLGFEDSQAQRRFEEGTRFRPVESFIPRSRWHNGHWTWVSQTGGTTGPPKHGCWDASYWDKVMELSDEFLDLHGVPRDCNWLFIGPTGPHTTGRLVINLAERRGGRCFSIDLDPRIVKIFGEEGMSDAQDRYLRHIWDQVKPIIQYQEVAVLFATSRLLEMLPLRLDVRLFRGIRAVVHAGTTMDRDCYRLLQQEVFPDIPIVGIYGTSTTGISFQKVAEEEDDFRVVYIPSSPYIVLEIVSDDGELVGYGEEGHVATYRLTEDYLIPGFWERDRGKRIRPYGQLAQVYPWDWVSDIYSPQFTVEGRVEGVY